MICQKTNRWKASGLAQLFLSACVLWSRRSPDEVGTTEQKGQKMAIHYSADPFEIQRNLQSYRQYTMLDSLDKV